MVVINILEHEYVKDNKSVSHGVAKLKRAVGVFDSSGRSERVNSSMLIAISGKRSVGRFRTSALDILV